MTLALVAGRGDLPLSVAAGVQGPVLVCGYEGIAVSGLAVDLTFRLETLGTLLQELALRGVSEVCFAGALERPALDPARIDAQTLPMVPVFMEALKAGDDGALRVVVGLFERAGFTVRGAHEIVPDLLAAGGVYGALCPDAQMRHDAGVGAAHILRMSPQDKGQACVVAAGQVIAMEDMRGTDAMLAALEKGADGILFKGPKAGQSRQIDLPTVGPDTLEAVHRAGLRGLVISAGGVLVLHPAACTALADERGLVFWACPGA